jgi:hypothetical protein
MKDNSPMVTIQPKRGIKIGDDEAVYAFYDQRFRSCQQAACKIIAKAWVKAVEPKKQSTHPYTRGDETRPDWWPKTFSKVRSDVVEELRHKEPDHLGKDGKWCDYRFILFSLAKSFQNESFYSATSCGC